MVLDQRQRFVLLLLDGMASSRANTKKDSRFVIVSRVVTICIRIVDNGRVLVVLVILTLCIFFI
jgi:hypothetical protein